MEPAHHFAAFSGSQIIATGDLRTVLAGTWEHLRSHDQGGLLIFDDTTGAQVDFDFRGSLEEVLARAIPEEPRKGPGRPRLGVVCGEVCLMPHHWEWLERQPHKASGTLRRLVEAARKSESREDHIRQRVEAAGKFLWSMAGDLQGFEEASRALYARRWTDLDTIAASWPEGIREHLGSMLRQARDPG